MSTFVPTGKVVEHVHGLGLHWHDLVQELESNPIVTPIPDRPGRYRYVTPSVDVIVAPGLYLGAPANHVLFVRRRTFAAVENIPAQAERGLPRAKGGGSGRRWPTSFPELHKLIERNKNARVLAGRKHDIVLLDGVQVASLPKTASDHRSLMNACRELMLKGIDVRRG